MHPSTDPPEPAWRRVVAVLAAITAPVIGVFGLTALAGLAYDRADATGDRIGARLVIGLALALPPLQVGAVVAMTRSVVVRVIAAFFGILSWPVYGGLVFMLSWNHH